MSLANVDIIILCDLYGGLLTKRQLEMLRLYYDYDNSLSEIAQIHGVTRQAVHDAVTKGVATLSGFEKKLRLKEKSDKISALADRILSEKAGNKISSAAEKIKKILSE